MSTEQTTGGFVTDPTEAFHPPAASGCCGSAPTSTDSSGCCGSAADAGGCCGSTEAAATEACCG